MGLTTDVEICNLALAKMGHKAAITTLTQANDAARQCNRLFEPERDLMMQGHPWNFAMKRVEYDEDDYDDIITATTAANPVVVTGTDISAANIVEGMGVYLWDTGLDDLDNEIFVATNVNDTAQTYELYKIDRATTVNGTAFGTATVGYARICPLYGYTYLFKLPTDCLQVHKVDGKDYKFEQESGFLLTDNDVPQVKYIALITNVSKYPKAFINCLSTKLAAELSVALGKGDRKQSLLKQLYVIDIPQAYRLNAIEGDDDNPSEDSSWQKAGR